MSRDSANSFDGIRLVASLAVVIGHAFPLLGQPSPSFWGLSIQTLAVRAFFIISGALVSESWVRDPSVWRFVSRRAARLLPGLWVAVILSAVVLGPVVTTLDLRSYFEHPTTRDYLLNCLLNIRYALPGAFETNIYRHAVNGSLWSLPVEAIAYIFVPLVFIVRSLTARKALLFAAAVVWAIAFFVIRERTAGGGYVWATVNWIFVAELMPYFFMGAFVNLVFTRTQLIEIGVIALFIQGLVAQPIAADCLRIVGFACLVLGLGRSSSYLGSRAARFGDFSYGVYLYGFPLQQLLISRGSAQMSAIANGLIVCVLSLICAVFSWHLVEKPMLELVRRHLRRVLVATHSADKHLSAST